MDIKSVGNNFFGRQAVAPEPNDTDKKASTGNNVTDPIKSFSANETSSKTTPPPAAADKSGQEEAGEGNTPETAERGETGQNVNTIV